MKKHIFFLALAFGLASPALLSAQQKQSMKVAAVKQDGKNVDFTLTSSKRLITGGNRYVLYVGDQEFMLSKQSYYKGTGSITFFVPSKDFGKLAEGADMYITYGRQFGGEEQSREELAKSNNRCWSLGKFSKTMLK